MEKKTILEILQAAKADGDEWAQAAIEAHENHPPKVSAKSNAIMYGFSWDETPQGYEYWSNIWHKQCEKESKK